MLVLTLRRLREQHGWSQEQLANRAACARSSISMIECGHTLPRKDLLQRLADALGVPVYTLFLDGDEPSPSTQNAAAHR